MRLMRQWADPAVEARSLVSFLETQRERRLGSSPAAVQQPPAALIHGRNTTSDVHKLAQRTAVFSVCSPFCNLDLNFDIRFALATNREGLDVLVANRHCSILGQDMQALLTHHGKIVDTTYQKLHTSQLVPGFALDGTALARMGSPMSVVAGYPYVMAIIAQTLQHLFPGIRCYHSEHAPLPLRVCCAKGRSRDREWNECQSNT